MENNDSQSPAPATAAPSVPEVRFPNVERVPLEFRGQAGEYFRIWIVNVALTLVTFGIYSAWAKVRTRRYFLGNTVLAGAAFDYHGDPLRILKGRLLIGVLFLAYTFGSKVSVYLSGAALGMFMVAFPWIIVKGMTFNLVNTSYRNLRFGFAPDYKGSYKTYLKAVLVAVFSLGLAMPSVIFYHSEFRVNHSRYGKTGFRFDGAQGPFYMMYLKAFAVYVGAAVLAAIIIAAIAFILGGTSKLAVVPVVLLYVGGIWGIAVIRGSLYNLVVSATTLGTIRFQGRLEWLQLGWIYLSNIVACSFTLGLLIPWAMVRTIRYRIENTVVEAETGAVEKFVADEQMQVGAAADAAVDFWDIDLGF